MSATRIPELVDTPDEPSAEVLAAEVTALRQEVEHLGRALESRTYTSFATGVLAERFACSRDQAWALLTRLSSLTNVKVAEIGQAIADLSDDPDDARAAALVRRVLDHLPQQTEHRRTSR